MIPASLVHAATGYNPTDGWDSIYWGMLFGRCDLRQTEYADEVMDAWTLVRRIDMRVMSMREKQDWIGV